MYNNISLTTKTFVVKLMLFDRRILMKDKLAKRKSTPVARLRAAISRTPSAAAVKCANEAMNCTKQGCGSSWA